MSSSAAAAQAHPPSSRTRMPPRLSISLPPASDSASLTRAALALVTASMPPQSAALDPAARPFTPRDVTFDGHRFFAPARSRKRGGRGRKSKLAESLTESLAAGLEASAGSDRPPSAALDAHASLLDVEHLRQASNDSDSGIESSAGSFIHTPAASSSADAMPYPQMAASQRTEMSVLSSPFIPRVAMLAAPTALRTHHHRLSPPPALEGQSDDASHGDGARNKLDTTDDASVLVSLLEHSSPARPPSVPPAAYPIPTIITDAPEQPDPMFNSLSPLPSTLATTLKDILAFEHQIAALNLLCAEIDSLLNQPPLSQHQLAQRVARRFASDRARAWVIVQLAGTEGDVLARGGGVEGSDAWCGAQWEVARRVLGEDMFDGDDGLDDGDAQQAREEMERLITSAIAAADESSVAADSGGLMLGVGNCVQRAHSDYGANAGGDAGSGSPKSTSSSLKRGAMSSIGVTAGTHRRPLRKDARISVNSRTLPRLLATAQACAERLAWLLRVLCEMEEWEWRQIDERERQAEWMGGVTEGYYDQAVPGEEAVFVNELEAAIHEVEAAAGFHSVEMRVW